MICATDGFFFSLLDLWERFRLFTGLFRDPPGGRVDLVPAPRSHVRAHDPGNCACVFLYWDLSSRRPELIMHGLDIEGTMITAAYRFIIGNKIGILLHVINFITFCYYLLRINVNQKHKGVIKPTSMKESVSNSSA